jgi:hypothetical protein
MGTTTAIAILPLLLREPLLELPAGSSAAPDEEVLVEEDEVPVRVLDCEVVVIVTTIVLEGSPDLSGVMTDIFVIVDTGGGLVVLVGGLVVGGVDVGVVDKGVGVLLDGGG